MGELIPRSLVESMPGALAAVDTEGRQIVVNPAFCQLVGWSAEELVDRAPPFAYWAPEDAAAIGEHFGAILRGEAPEQGLVLRFCRRNGERFLVRFQAAPVLDEGGHIAAWMTAVEDVRQAGAVEAALRQRERFIESVARAVPDVIYVYDLRERRYAYANRHIAEALGYSPEEVRAMGPDFLPALLHPDDREGLSAHFARWEKARDGQVIETTFRMRSAGGDYRWFQARDSVFQRDRAGRVTQYIGAAEDVTERRRAEAARDEAARHLRESERRYRLLADHATDLIARHDPSGVYRDASPASARLIGYTPVELIGRTEYELVHPDDRDRVFRFHREIVAHQSARTLTYRARRKDGAFVWIETHAQPITDPETGEVVELLAVSRDVTDRINAEEALRRSEELFRTLVERGSDGIAMLTEHGQVRYLSPAAGRILGYDQAELAGVDIRTLVLPEDYQAFAARARGPLATPGASFACQVRARSRAGAIRHLEIVVTNHLEDPYIHGYVVNFRDVTDRIELEEQLRQAQKMEAVGQLAGGIAHDFNNILTAIIGNVALLQDATPADDPKRATLESVEAAARRAAELTNRLLGYSRRTTLHLRATDLNRVVTETLTLLRPTIDPRVVYDLRLAPDLWPVMADADQLSHVITNLCLNARDAMPDGGRLTVATTNVVETPPADAAGAGPEEHVCLTVEDTGVGMTPEVRAHIFEPFFTTKPTGVGTGLGLAMVDGIVKSHGGWVTCASEPGVGTRMRLYFPRSELPVEAARPAGATNGVPDHRGGGETVLLVDDEPAVRTLGRFILEQHGYRVLVAEDGQDAVEAFRAAADEVALVILDLTMPRMSGQDAFRRMREIAPDVRVLFSSGYSADHLGDVGTGVGFISKPYRPAELLDAVRAHLRGAGDMPSRFA